MGLILYCFDLGGGRRGKEFPSPGAARQTLENLLLRVGGSLQNRNFSTVGCVWWGGNCKNRHHPSLGKLEHHGVQPNAVQDPNIFCATENPIDFLCFDPCTSAYISHDTLERLWDKFKRLKEECRKASLHGQWADQGRFKYNPSNMNSSFCYWN